MLAIVINRQTAPTSADRCEPFPAPNVVMSTKFTDRCRFFFPHDLRVFPSCCRVPFIVRIASNMIAVVPDCPITRPLSVGVIGVAAVAYNGSAELARFLWNIRPFRNIVGIIGMPKRPICTRSVLVFVSNGS